MSLVIDLTPNFCNQVSKHAPEIVLILRMHLDEIRWYDLFQPKYKYQQLKASRDALHQELFAELYHPKRIASFLQHNNNIDEYLP